jgi:pheromone shutdown protein TraB
MSSSSHKSAKRVGRYTSPQEQGRVTVASEHPEEEHSPRWYGWMLLDLVIFGLLVIALNYLQVLPGATSSWYLLLGLVSLFSAFYAATKYK